MAEQAIGASAGAPRNSMALVIGGASLGSLFEWYDFFLYGALTTDIARRFFSSVNETTAFLLTLAAFGAGFAVRPLGALIFGRIGDMVGRKYTFLITMVLMGLATFAVGVLPDFNSIGIAAPILLVCLRLLQGLSIGGEYGGAAIYVAEHAPADRRGLDTSWINATGMVGLALSLAVIILCRVSLTTEQFQSFGWRIPFLASIGLLAVSLWIRFKLNESPVFQQMKAEGTVSKAPYAETFGNWANVRTMMAVFLMTAGGTSVYYAAQLYALVFLERTLKLDGLTADVLIAVALAIAAPSYLLVGWLSDRIGRKIVILGGCVIAAFALFPLFHQLTLAANPALAAAQQRAPVVVVADPATCAFQFDPLNTRHFDRTGCDVAHAFLSKAGVNYRNQAGAAGAPAEIHVGAARVTASNALVSADAAELQTELRGALTTAGYPEKAAPEAVNKPVVVLLAVVLAILGALVFAPAAAFLVELFPARIRYTSFSTPYHLATGWIGGFLPATAVAIVVATGNIYAGLWYPVAFAALAAVSGWLLLPETKGRPI
ncbi:MAG TPA: MFS transporter [Vitreimonas sp.]|jgi:MFS family permease|nr:MFS transporter [Vitreimonas sp.]